MNLKTAKLPVLMCLLLMMILAAGCVKNNLAAEVNGEKITMEQYNRRVDGVKANFEQQGVDFESEKELADNIKERVLDEMIEEILVRQQAKKKGVEPSKEEIDKKIKEIKDSYQTEAEYKKALKENKISERELRDIIYNELAANNLYQKVTAGVKEATDEQAEDYYRQNKDRFKIPERLNTRHILFFVNEDNQKNIPVKRSDEEARKLAQQVIDSLNRGADFAELAKEKSEDLGTKDKGGFYSFVPELGMTDPGYTKAAQALAEGEYTKEPVRSRYGYHVIKLEKRIPAQVRSFNEVQGFIKEQLTREAKMEYYRSFMADVREKADIKKYINE